MSALIASLMREQRASEDRAIFDAYNNGGLYKGKPVDDATILKYIEKRRDGFDTQDPLYDEWNNRLIQTKFIIGEQKIGLAYKQGRVGAGAVAAYYRGALKNIPKNSAFYRDVAGRAAEWAKGASRAAGGRARGRATAGLRKKLNQQLEDQQGYLSLEAGLTAYARAQGLISGTQTLSDADASELQDMFRRGLYAGTKQITWGDFVRAARGYYRAVGSEIATRLAMGNQAVEARKKRSKFLNGTLVKLNVMDEREQYEKAREAWLDARSAAGEDPYANAAADAEYAAALKGIAANVQAGNGPYSEDPEFIGGLINEVDLLETGKSNGKTVSDLYDYQGPGSKELAAGFEAIKTDLDLLSTRKAYLGQSEPGGAIHVVKWPTGLGVNPLGLDDSLQPSYQFVNGEKKLVYLKGQAVTASVILDQGGNYVDTKTIDPVELANGLRNGTYFRENSQTPIGYMFTNPQGDIKYGVIDKATGNMVFTNENPWGSDVTNVNGELVVSSGGVVDVGGKVRPDVNLVYDPNKALPSLQNSDPLLTDGPVSTSDLLALVNEGDLKMSPEDLAAYKSRLAYEAASATTYGSPDRVDERWRTNMETSESSYDRREQAHYDGSLRNLVPQIQSMMGVGDYFKERQAGVPSVNSPPPIPSNGDFLPPRPAPNIAIHPVHQLPPKPPKPAPTPPPIGDTPAGVDPDTWNAYGPGGPGGP